MPMMAAGGMAAVGGIASGVLGSMSGNKQIQAMRDAINFQKQIYADTQNNLKPYREFGTDQLNSLTDFLKTKNPSNYIDPGYDFRLKAGTNAISNNAAATGMIQSGDTLRALDEYGQNMGSQEYSNAFNRYLGEGQFKQGLAGMGQNAAVSQGVMGNQAAGNVGNLTENTNWGGQIQPFANLAGGAAGAGMNMFAKRYGAPNTQIPGSGSDPLAGFYSGAAIS